MFHLTDNVWQCLLDGFTKKSYVIQFGLGIYDQKKNNPKFYSIWNAAILTYKGNSWVGKSEIEPIYEGECSNKCIL